MEKETKDMEAVQLPENAFRELKEGEKYEPVMSPNKVYPEVNSWSVIWGILMAVLYPHSYYCCRRIYSRKASQCTWRERYYSKYRRLLGCCCSRCYLYFACHIYIASQVS